MSLFELTALLVVLASFAGLVNYHWLKLHPSIGMVAVSLFATVALLIVNTIVPYDIVAPLATFVNQFDFYTITMDWLLAFLLFAGAMHVDMNDLLSKKWPILGMATLGVLISTFFIGSVFWYLTGLIGISIPFIWCLVIGSIVSPTDPIAVLGIVKSLNAPKELEAKIAGESLFNDGVGVVVFIILVALASTGAAVDPVAIAKLFAVEVVGGVAIGAVFGYIAYIGISKVNEYQLEILITIALAMSAYAVAAHFHMSGPLAVVIAGLFIGNHGKKFGMSKETQEHTHHFWDLADSFMNAVLFMLIGLEVVTLNLVSTEMWMAAGILLVITLIGRFLSVATPITLLKPFMSFSSGAIQILTWGGLRGGISVALALSLPDTEFKPLILMTVYVVVVFSILVQGTTISKLLKRYI